MRPCKFNRLVMCNHPCGWRVSSPPFWCNAWKRGDISKEKFKEKGYKKIWDRFKIGRGKPDKGSLK